jgi:hypothetical protein
MNKFLIGMAAASIFISTSAFAAVRQYKLNMRVGLKGSAPISINTVTKSGKKAYISEFSDDGQNETIVEVMARKANQNSRAGLYMDVTVTKRVRGKQKVSERTQIFAPENQETEYGVSPKGKTAGNLSLAVVAHQL